MSKTAQSGLRTLKREFSSSSGSQGTQDSAINWPPPQAAPAAKTLTKDEQRAKRLRDIEEALSGKASLDDRRNAQPAPLHANPSATNLSKRPSATDIEDAPAAKKPRQLPSQWRQDAAKSLSSAKTSTGVRSINGPSTAGSSKKALAGVFLSDEQTQILRLVEEGNSVFYTGSAGTGKSVLLREIIKSLRKKYSKIPDAVAITASTGIAACNIGGVTIHSFGGIGLGIESAEDLANKIRKNKKAMTRWLRTKVLIIDEISMVDGDLFDKLARIGQLLRKRAEPFGGIQVIVTGDFFQLPPVSKAGTPKFAFEATLWKQTIKRTFNLTKVFRQTDQEFVDMLNEMRFGRLSSHSIARFKSLSRPVTYEDGVDATELFPRREDVDMANRRRMNQLRSEPLTFRAVEGGTAQGDQREKLLNNFMCPRDVVLRETAQVMLIKNYDETLVNGSMGRVIRFEDPATYSGDMTSDDPKDARAGMQKKQQQGEGGSGMRTAGGSGAQVTGDAKKHTAGVKQTAGVPSKRYPVVEFITPHGTREMLVMPDTFKVELPNGEIQASRTQLPLILAWAMSIHKSQGQTLPRVKVDLGKVFEKGQAYVALSRATSLDGLQVLNFDENKVRVHPKVVEWVKTLETIKC